MKRLTLFLAVALMAGGISTAQAQTQQERLMRHVYTLASDSLQGRKAGSSDAAKARAYIEREWKAMGLKPLWDGSYRMAFALADEEKYCNLVAIIEGIDPKLKSEYIVIGGHYDHLGVKRGEVYNGADDNASGTACVTEVARQLLARQKELKRSVIICAFDAEEMGLFGSSHLANTMAELNMLGRVKVMISVDMVGWLKEGKSLKLEGTGTLADGRVMTDPKTLGIDIPIHNKRFENSIFTATDTEPFAKRGVATLAVTTGLKSPYHKPQDDANLIDYEGLDLVTDYMAALTMRLANHEGSVTSGKVAPKHTNKVKPVNLGIGIGYNSAWLGFPDAAFTGKSRMGGQAGLAMQFNFNNTWALHTNVVYTYTRTLYPDVNNLFNVSRELNQQTVTVPVMVRLNVGDRSSSVHISAGGYYSYQWNRKSFLGEETYRSHQWGLGCGFGVRLGYNWDLSFMALYQVNHLFGGAGLPKAYKNLSSCTLTYYFL